MHPADPRLEVDRQFLAAISRILATPEELEGYAESHQTYMWMMAKALGWWLVGGHEGHDYFPGFPIGYPRRDRVAILFLQLHPEEDQASGRKAIDDYHAYLEAKDLPS